MRWPSIKWCLVQTLGVLYVLHFGNGRQHLQKPDTPARSSWDTTRSTTAQIELGRRLFSETRLSRNRRVSCATCHSPRRAFTEGRAISEGLGNYARRRNAPSLVGVTFQRSMDWDGRAGSLEEQLDGVFSAGGDMGHSIGSALKALVSEPTYRAAFVLAYGHTPTTGTLRRALAAYQRTLVFNDSRFDRFYFGGDTAALSAAELRGWALFRTRANCAGCHHVLAYMSDGTPIALFSDQGFHNLGIGFQSGWMSDKGRYAVSRQRRDWGAFKTPSLRNVGLTAPYMHDGSLASLEEVVAFYVRGGTANPMLDATIVQRTMSAEEQRDLVAFLHTLSSEQLLPTARPAKQH